jgi:hypothetical protein
LTKRDNLIKIFERLDYESKMIILAAFKKSENKKMKDVLRVMNRQVGNYHARIQKRIFSVTDDIKKTEKMTDIVNTIYEYSEKFERNRNEVPIDFLTGVVNEFYLPDLPARNLNKAYKQIVKTMGNSMSFDQDLRKRDTIRATEKARKYKPKYPIFRFIEKEKNRMKKHLK